MELLPDNLLSDILDFNRSKVILLVGIMNCKSYF